MRSKVFLVVLDGAGDRACPSLGGRTPLMCAKTPNLDAFARSAQCGLMEALGPGVAPSSELAHFTLFGYDVDTQFPGRGLLEALGEGLDPLPEEVVLRARFCLVRKREMRLVTEARAPRLPEEDARAMAGAIAEQDTDGVLFRYRYTGRGDGLLFLRGGEGAPVSAHMRDSDPFADGVDLRRPAPEAAAPDPEAARRTAHALSGYLLEAFRQLNRLDLGAVRDAHADGLRWALLSKWAGQWRDIPPFSGWTGMKGGAVASSPLFRGMARYLGMRFIEPAEMSGPGEEIREKIRLGREALAGDLDFVFLHIKAADDASHHGGGGAGHKVEVLEAMDAGIGDELKEMARSGEAIVCVTSDHATPSEAGAAPGDEAAMVHGAELVPFAVAGRGVTPDRVEGYDEVEFSKGMLGRFHGIEAMPRLLAYADRGRRAGLRPAPPGSRPEPPPAEPLWDVSAW